MPDINEHTEPIVVCTCEMPAHVLGDWTVCEHAEIPTRVKREGIKFNPGAIGVTKTVHDWFMDFAKKAMPVITADPRLEKLTEIANEKARESGVEPESLESVYERASFSFMKDIIAGLLDRHVHGDWGVIDSQDAEQNEKAITEGQRIVSSYVFTSKVQDEPSIKLWVITEADRSMTTVLFPEDY